ncbi:hypothetical protein Mapa_001143 [Marchantia paleacea]|nr:hypothetical protein Mapa_001143 [Marchantia paleacea]
MLKRLDLWNCHYMCMIASRRSLLSMNTATVDKVVPTKMMHVSMLRYVNSTTDGNYVRNLELSVRVERCWCFQFHPD